MQTKANKQKKPTKNIIKNASNKTPKKKCKKPIQTHQKNHQAHK
jgi:hypothetical protein